MARAVTLQSIADRARLYSDTRNSGFVDPDEMLVLLNDAYTELYDLLVDSNENYYVTEGSPFNISSSTDTYDLPADFYKMVGVDYKSGSGWVTLTPFNEMDRNLPFGDSTGLPSGQVRFRYVPAPTVFTDLAQTVDGVSGWDQLLALEVALVLLDAEESNSDRIDRRIRQLKGRIIGSQDRDLGMPSTVTDVYKNTQMIGTKLKYRISGNSIKLITCEIAGLDTSFV